jgi:hypothetical protein
MITFPELREVFETYNPAAQFVIFNTKTRAVLGQAVGYEAAKDRARQVRQQQNLKFDDVSFMTSRRFYGATTGQQGASGTSAASAPRKIPFGVSRDGRTFTNAYGQRSSVEYSRNYNPSKRGRFRGYTDAQGNYHDID